MAGGARLEEQYQTFIVRLSKEAAEEGLRGQVEHVGTRRSVYFSDAGKMLRFMDAQLARWPSGSGRRPAEPVEAEPAPSRVESEE